jgi:branched-chain amino acid transport system substrate-binding protein
MLKVGVLLPRSSLFPALGIDLLKGIKTGAAALFPTLELQFVTDNIGFGTNEQDIYTRSEKMLLQDDVAVVVAIADTRIAEILQPMFTASNKILLMVNFGANYPVSWEAPATTIVHSLNFAFHCFLTGQLSAQHGNGQGVNLVSYYDGGYSQCHALLNAHQQAGGTPVYNHVTSLKTADFTLAPLQQFLQEHPDNTTFNCLFAGEMATLFYQQVAALDEAKDATLFVSPMMLEESLTGDDEHPLQLPNTIGYTPWISTLPDPANEHFTHTIREKLGVPANLFLLLGWETAILLYQINEQLAQGNTKAIQIIKNCCNTRFESPRGWFMIDAATHHSFSPSRRIRASGNLQMEVTEELGEPEAKWRDFIAASVVFGESSSWRNTYLCI